MVYIIANLPGKTRVDLPSICRTCGVAEGTIRQIYREIHPHLKARRCCCSSGRLCPCSTPAKLRTPSRSVWQPHRLLTPHSLLPRAAPILSSHRAQALIAKAGGFATDADIDTLPIPVALPEPQK